MATTGRSAEATPAPERAATLCQEAEFVHLVGSANGDALAAVGVLGQALDSLSVPYQASIARTAADAETRLINDGTAISLGHAEIGDAQLTDGSLALAADETARHLDADPDPILAIGGAIAGGYSPSGPALEAAEDAGVERRPGLGLPTADLTTGLAYSGWLHAEISGDEQRAGAFLAEVGLPAELDDDARTKLASIIALEATETGTGDQSASGIENIVAPLRSPGPFETIEGLADVLDAMARSATGTGLSHVLGHAEPEAAIEAWKAARKRLHRTVGRIELEDREGFHVGAMETPDALAAARLVRDFRVGTDVVIVGREAVALATTDREAAGILQDIEQATQVHGKGTLAEAVQVGDPDSLLENLEGGI